MTEPKWVSRVMVTSIHAEVIRHFGGLSGIRNTELLESALGRPRNLYAYDQEATLFELAAALCIGLIKNHPFNDGNKRTGLLAARAFLYLNHYVLEPDEVDEVQTIVNVAGGLMGESELADWLMINAEPSD